MDLETVLIATRGVINLATFAVIIRYYDPSARYRFVVSIVATLIAAFSLGLAVWTAYALWLPSCMCTTPGARIHEFLLLGLFIILFGLVLRSRGNVAKLLPWRLQR